MHQIVERRNQTLARLRPVVHVTVTALGLTHRVNDSWNFTRRLFSICVFMPAILAGIYYGLIASDVYVADADFIVRSNGGSQTGGLTPLFRSFGLSRADDDTFAVQSFIRSRDAVRDLQASLPLEKIFSRPQGDRFARYPLIWRGSSAEALYEYYLQSVKINYNTSTGITHLTVEAFQADDAYQIANTLLRASENFVNRINARAQHDTLQSAKDEVALAEKRVVDAQGRITNFRNRELLFDPGSTSEKSLDIVAQLAAELVKTQTMLQQLQSSTPLNPAIQTLQERARIIKEQIDQEKKALTGNNNSLTSKIANYEQLVFAKELADRALAAASDTVELARQEVRRQQIYLEMIANPNLPDEAVLPRRWRSVFAAAVVGFCVFGVLWFLYAASKEHIQETERRL